MEAAASRIPVALRDSRSGPARRLGSSETGLKGVLGGTWVPGRPPPRKGMR